MLRRTIRRILDKHAWMTPLAGAVYYAMSGNKKKIKGNGNIVRSSGAFLRKVSFDIEGSGNEIVVGSRTKLSHLKVFVRGSNHKLHIREGCTIKNGVLWFEDMDCLVEIGAQTTIENAHIAVTEPGSSITVGEDCMFSFGIDIRSGDSHSIIDLNSGNRINRAKDVRIGNHVWLGANVQILKGTTIHDNSVIGARSVVSGVIGGNSIAAGAPARVIRSDIDWRRERI
ncbi:acyltransferase [Cohnella sp. GCM10027633]|uniref:acyltransferase n=1 Tax=unclassified Cohnella TaxID=2636738 RepID=UPI0036281072